MTGTFRKASFEAVTEALIAVLHENDEALTKVEDILSKAGIRFNHQPLTEGIAIEGYSSIEEGTPTIVLSLKRDRIDDLAFHLLHELWFIYNALGDNQKMHLRLRGDEPENDAAEKKAEEFAMTVLVPNDKWKLKTFRIHERDSHTGQVLRMGGGKRTEQVDCSWQDHPRDRHVDVQDRRSAPAAHSRRVCLPRHQNT